MKMKLLNGELAKAVGAVKGVVARDALSAFGMVRLDAAGVNTSITACNGEIQIEWRMKSSDSVEDGTLVLPGAAFAAFAAAMPDGTVEISGKPDAKATIACDAVKYHLAAGDAASFPVMAGPKDEARVALHISAMVVREMLRKVSFAASTDETRSNLCGVNVALKNGTLGMTATDGRRLAHVEHECVAEADQPGMDITLASKTVKILSSLIEKSETVYVDMTFDGSALRIVGDTFCMTAKVLASVYPAWRKVVPRNPKYVARIKREAFIQSLGRVALSMDMATGATVKISEGLITFGSRNSNSSSAIKMVGCKTECAHTFTVNPLLFKEALEVIEDDEFSLHFDDVKFCPIKITAEIPWLAVIMPYREG